MLKYFAGFKTPENMKSLYNDLWEKVQQTAVKAKPVKEGDDVKADDGGDLERRLKAAQDEVKAIKQRADKEIADLNERLEKSQLAERKSIDKICELESQIKIHADQIKELQLKGTSRKAKKKAQLLLLSAAKKGETGDIRKLLSENPGIEVDAKDNVNASYNALMLAAMNGHDDCCVALLNYGANIEAKNYDGRTSLSLAAEYGHANVVRRLALQCGADVNAADNKRYTPLMLAAMYGHLEVAEILLAQKANITNKSDDNFTALDLAKRYGHALVLEILHSHLSHGNSCETVVESETKIGG